MRAINRDKTSSVADSDAAAVCARRIGGKALEGLVLEQAETRSLIACCNSLVVRCTRSRFSRSARVATCSIGLDSCAIGLSGTFRTKFPALHIGSSGLGSQPARGSPVPNYCPNWEHWGRESDSPNLGVQALNAVNRAS